jgi:hypothetical protein
MNQESAITFDINKVPITNSDGFFQLSLLEEYRNLLNKAEIDSAQYGQTYEYIYKTDQDFDNKLANKMKKLVNLVPMFIDSKGNKRPVSYQKDFAGDRMTFAGIVGKTIQSKTGDAVISPLDIDSSKIRFREAYGITSSTGDNDAQNRVNILRKQLTDAERAKQNQINRINQSITDIDKQINSTTDEKLKIELEKKKQDLIRSRDTYNREIDITRIKNEIAELEPYLTMKHTFEPLGDDTDTVEVRLRKIEQNIITIRNMLHGIMQNYQQLQNSQLSKVLTSISDSIRQLYSNKPGVGARSIGARDTSIIGRTKGLFSMFSKNTGDREVMSKISLPFKNTDPYIDTNMKFILSQSNYRDSVRASYYDTQDNTTMEIMKKWGGWHYRIGNENDGYKIFLHSEQNEQERTRRSVTESKYSFTRLAKVA